MQLSDKRDNNIEINWLFGENNEEHKKIIYINIQDSDVDSILQDKWVVNFKELGRM